MSGRIPSSRTIIVDSKSRRVHVSGTEVHLTALEFDLLERLSRSRGQVLTYANLANGLCSFGGMHANALSVHITHLRKKLSSAGAPDAVENVRAVGYRLSPVNAHEAEEPFGLPLVGRHRELELLCDALGRTSTNCGTAVAVVGEAGMGKSALVGEFMRYVGASGVSVVKSLPISEFSAYHTFDHIWRLCTEAATQGPTVIVVEDLHQADADSVRLVHGIAEQVSEIPLLLLATFRPPLDDSHGRSLEALREIKKSGTWRIVPLRPLVEEETALLLDSVGPALREFAADVHAQTDGHPGATADLIEALATCDSASVQFIEALWRYPGLRRMVAAKLSDLGDKPRHAE